MSQIDVNDALKRLQSSFEALAETRHRLFDEVERATADALQRFEAMVEIFDCAEEAAYTPSACADPGTDHPRPVLAGKTADAVASAT